MKLTQLATDPIDVTLYVLAHGPAAAGDLGVTYDGAVKNLQPAPPAELKPLFAGEEHVTKLSASGADPGRFTSDLAIRTVSAVTPRTHGAPKWVAVLIAAAALGVVALMRRTQA